MFDVKRIEYGRHLTLSVLLSKDLEALRLSCGLPAREGGRSWCMSKCWSDHSGEAKEPTSDEAAVPFLRPWRSDLSNFSALSSGVSPAVERAGAEGD